MEPRDIAERHRRRAQVALDLGRFQAAEREARSALSADPRDDEAQVLLARAYLGSGAYEAALKAGFEACAA